ncbi:serine/threonine-protein kinase [Tundrisphaera lichenicola]|uniref:serine/threonine-protein kinase n=1 Tax=Tundrisphaera lichenicola TaxID=2029860 RepID=UPI003EBEE65A
MPRADADRNLLFGILALQMDFITRDELIAGMNSWILEKHRPLGEILGEQRVLAPRLRKLLDSMIAAQVERHAGNSSVCLAALSSIESASSALRSSIADRDVLESLALISSGKLEDPYATRVGHALTRISVGSRYSKLRAHAWGGLGVVYVARDEELNREVALKEIQERHADDPDSRSRFLIEAEVTGGLEHPGIVPVYGLGFDENDRPFYAMRFIRGESLKEAITTFHANPALLTRESNRSLALRKLLSRFLDVCNAIEYAHSQGVLHRDLKPDNIMLGRFGETLVVDWGLAKVTGRTGGEPTTSLNEGALAPSSSSGSHETLPGSTIGTPAYMSPEQASGDLDRLGPISDVYSLGATFYQLLTGRAPFIGKPLDELLSDVQNGRFPLPRSISSWIDPPLQAICLKAMALHPKNRYTSPRALADDIEYWLADEPATAFRESRLALVSRWLRKRPLTRSWMLSLLVVNVIALMAWVGLFDITYAMQEATKDIITKHKNMFDSTTLEIYNINVRLQQIVTLLSRFLTAEFGAAIGLFAGSIAPSRQRTRWRLGLGAVGLGIGAMIGPSLGRTILRAIEGRL